MSTEASNQNTASAASPAVIPPITVGFVPSGGPPLVGHQALKRGLLASVVVHALLFSLQMTGQGPGLPSFTFPWEARRTQEPDLRGVLQPPPAPPTSSTSTLPLPGTGAPDKAASTTSNPNANAWSTALTLVNPAPPTAAATKPVKTTKKSLQGKPKRPPISATLPQADGSAGAAQLFAQSTLPLANPMAGSPTGATHDAVLSLSQADNATWTVPPPSETTLPEPAAAAGPPSPDLPQPATRETQKTVANASPTSTTEPAQVDDKLEKNLPLAPKPPDPAEAQRLALALAQQEASRQEAARQQQALVEIARVESERQAEAKRDASRLEAARLEIARQDLAKRDAARAEAVRAEAVSAEAVRAEAVRAEAVRAEAVRAEAVRAEAVRAEAARAEAARAEAARVAAVRAEAARAEAARVESARQRQEAALLEAQQRELARLALARQEAERQEVARQIRVQQEAARQEAARQEATRLEAVRQETARADANRQEAIRQEAARAEAARVSAAQAAAAQQAAGQPASTRAELQPASSAQDTARAEAARLATRQADEEKREERLRAIGRQLNEEADRRDAAAAAQRLSPSASPLRRGRLFGRADPNGELVLYAEAWARKIQLNMTTDMVRELARQPHNDPMVTVAIRSDGSVESINFVRSSGVPTIDEAIRRIVQAQAPYTTFSPLLARDYDVVEIRRTWHFDMAVRLY